MAIIPPTLPITKKHAVSGGNTHVSRQAAGLNYYCPICGEVSVQRERRPGGNDTCSNGYVYPSPFARKDMT